MDTVEALKRTPKGQISYTKPWEERSPSEKQAFLEAISSPPLISGDVTHHRTHPPAINESPRTPPQTPPLSPLTYPSPLPSLRSPGPLASITASDIVSPVKVIQEELNEYHEKNEDSIMKEIEDSMIRWRKCLKKVVERQFGTPAPVDRIWQIRDKSKRIKDLEEEEEQKELKKIIEEKLKSSEESYLSHFQSVQEDITKNEERRVQEMKELQETRRKRKAQFKDIEQRAMSMAQNMNLILQSCRYPSLLANDAVEPAIKNFNVLIGRLINESRVESQSKSPSEETLRTLGTCLHQCEKLVSHMKGEVEKANDRGHEQEKKRVEEEKQRQAELEKLKKEQEERARQMQQPVQVDLTSKGGKGKAGAPSQGGGDSLSLGVTVSPSALQSYAAYQKKLENEMKITEKLSKSSDAKLKKLRFDLQKAVNTPVCGISSQSGAHLFDKIRRLQQLLSGATVEVVGGQVSIGEHLEAQAYCLNFLAKKLVKQGEEQVSSRPVTAFPIAAVIVYLSCDFPELMELFVANCLASCPILIPMYFEKSSGTNEIEYRKLQGYKVSEGGVVEKEDIFLKRIGGIIRLLAAVMQTNINDKPNLHGLERCWTWLARILNMEPKPNITATAILNVLEVCGNAMMKRYGRQFQKLVQLLYKDYLPRIAKVTPADEQGPYSRLKMFLDECVSKNSIPRPEGILTNEFWNSYTKTNIIGD